MRHGERPNKSPIYGKMLQSDGNRQPATGNNYTLSYVIRVNTLLAHIFSPHTNFILFPLWKQTFTQGFFINQSKEFVFPRCTPKQAPRCGVDE
jgi:hypothetical protein